jgi:hypothetical protein
VDYGEVSEQPYRGVVLANVPHGRTRAIWAMKAARPISVPSGLVLKKSRCPVLVSSSRSSHDNDAIRAATPGAQESPVAPPSQVATVPCT